MRHQGRMLMSEIQHVTALEAACQLELLIPGKILLSAQELPTTAKSSRGCMTADRSLPDILTHSPKCLPVIDDDQHQLDLAFCSLMQNKVQPPEHMLIELPCKASRFTCQENSCCIICWTAMVPDSLSLKLDQDALQSDSPRFPLCMTCMGHAHPS